MEEETTERQDEKYSCVIRFGRAAVRVNAEYMYNHAQITYQHLDPQYKAYKYYSISDLNLIRDMESCNTLLNYYEWEGLQLALGQYGKNLPDIVRIFNGEDKTIGGYEEEMVIVFELIPFLMDLDTEEEIETFFHLFMKVKQKQAQREQKTLSVKTIENLINNA